MGGGPGRCDCGAEGRHELQPRCPSVAGKLTAAMPRSLRWSGSNPAGRLNGCSSRRIWPICRRSCAILIRHTGHGARAGLQSDRPRWRGAGRGGAAGQGLCQGDKVRRPDTCDCGGGASGILVSPPPRAMSGISGGLEFLRSIPGTVGGFVRMNGGAYGREVKDILVDCDVVLRDGELHTAARCGSALHLSSFRNLPEGAIVVAARFRGQPGEAGGDPGRNGPYFRQPRSQPAAAQQDRRQHVQEPRRGTKPGNWSMRRAAAG